MKPIISDHDRLNRPDRDRPAPWSPRARRLSAAAAALAVSGAIAACGSAAGGQPATASDAAASAPAAASSSGAASTQPAKVVSTGRGGVTLHVGDQAGTGAQALLSAAGLLRKLPFKVSWADFTSGPPMLEAMSAGDLDIGGVGDAPPVFAAAGGAKISVVGALSINPNAGALLLPKSSTITSIDGLKGKKIAVAQGSSADYHLLTVLSKAGLSVHDVTLEYLQPAQALAAFSTGAVDAWDVWAPFIQQAVAQDGAKILVNGQGYGSNYSYEVASKPAISDSAKAGEIKDYLKLLDRAHVWANTHPAAWAKTWSAATGLPESVMTRAAADDTAKPVPVDSTTVTAEQSLVDAFSKAGLIPTRFDFSKYADDGFNSTVGAR
jgi:sulfonate transport system substrate-binding protein